MEGAGTGGPSARHEIRITNLEESYRDLSSAISRQDRMASEFRAELKAANEVLTTRLSAAVDAIGKLDTHLEGYKSQVDARIEEKTKPKPPVHIGWALTSLLMFLGFMAFIWQQVVIEVGEVNQETILNRHQIYEIQSDRFMPEDFDRLTRDWRQQMSERMRAVEDRSIRADERMKTLSEIAGRR